MTSPCLKMLTASSEHHERCGWLRVCLMLVLVVRVVIVDVHSAVPCLDGAQSSVLEAGARRGCGHVHDGALVTLVDAGLALAELLNAVKYVHV